MSKDKKDSERSASPRVLSLGSRLKSVAANQAKPEPLDLLPLCQALHAFEAGAFVPSPAESEAVEARVVTLSAICAPKGAKTGFRFKTEGSGMGEAELKPFPAAKPFPPSKKA